MIVRLNVRRRRKLLSWVFLGASGTWAGEEFKGRGQDRAQHILFNYDLVEVGGAGSGWTGGEGGQRKRARTRATNSRTRKRSNTGSGQRKGRAND